MSKDASEKGCPGGALDLRRGGPFFRETVRKLRAEFSEGFQEEQHAKSQRGSIGKWLQRAVEILQEQSSGEIFLPEQDSFLAEKLPEFFEIVLFESAEPTFGRGMEQSAFGFSLQLRVNGTVTPLPSEDVRLVKQFCSDSIHLKGGDGAQEKVDFSAFFSSRLTTVLPRDLFLRQTIEAGRRSLALLPLCAAPSSGRTFGALLFGYQTEGNYWSAEVRTRFTEISKFFGELIQHEMDDDHLPLFRRERPHLLLRETKGIITPGHKDDGKSPSSEEAAPPEFQRLLSYGQLILIKTDTEFRITEVIGGSERLFGFRREELIGRRDLWERLIDPLDLRRIGLRLRRMGARAQEFGEEIRFYQKGDPAPRWLLLKATPVFDESGEPTGWEGFGVDITDRRLVELQLRSQRQRTEALYEVSRALRVNLDPALVTLKGLNALVRATGSDAGLCCFYDSSQGELEMVAAEGLSQRYLEGISGIVDGPNLIRYTVEEQKGLLVDNIQEDPRAARELAQLEDLKSTVLMPLLSGGKVLGALVIFSREAGRFGREDFQLVSAAASQISFAARQAEYYMAEKSEADLVGVLYRLTHDISRLYRLPEIGESLFSVLTKEFSCKRLWFGVLNNQGTHIAGQAALGPGIPKRITEVQVELGLRHDFLDEAVQTKRPVIVPSGQEMECSGLNTLFKLLKPGAFIIVPMVSLGQVIGVLVVEPQVDSEEFLKKKRSFLSRVANEVAVVLMARRFEERVAESDKMRVATMLASGVAHNFNNLLQAVMGQASLVQMHAPADSPLQDIAKTIVDSAAKGASLVKHLLSFSSPPSAAREPFSVRRLLECSKDLYGSLLGSQAEIQMSLEDHDFRVLGDEGLVQQALTNLVINAKEAIGSHPHGRVGLSAKLVRLRSGEVDPSLSPGSYVRVDISDNGEGMDEERVARCFEPFYSSKDLDQSTGLSLSGAGLGLSSAYALVKQHGGVLTASSIPGEGTTFSLFLPLSESPGSSRTMVSSDSHEKGRALLIQPRGSTGESVQKLFDDFGVITTLIHDLSDIDHLMHSLQEDVSLVVLDGDFFREQGGLFIDRLRQARGGVSVVVLTSGAEAWRDREEGDEECIVVEKPLSMRTLRSVVRKFFTADSARTASVANPAVTVPSSEISLPHTGKGELRQQVEVLPVERLASKSSNSQKPVEESSLDEGQVMEKRR
ncbi:GAF domain-containing protein [bacterium]|nr:GAF domain-containing protein [bacterium]